MRTLTQNIQVSLEYDVYLTKAPISPSTPFLSDLFPKKAPATRVWVVIDSGLRSMASELTKRIELVMKYAGKSWQLSEAPVWLPGGQEFKANPAAWQDLRAGIQHNQLDRHALIWAIGGGAFLDTVGYVAGTTHGGIPVLKTPSTLLSMFETSGAIKNAIHSKRPDFQSVYAPPKAILLDMSLLESIDDETWREGLIGALRMGIAYDHRIYDFIEDNLEGIVNRSSKAAEELIYRVNQLQIDLLRARDPFERHNRQVHGFGIWATQKLLELTDFQLSYAKALIVGVALDIAYSMHADVISESCCIKALSMFRDLGYDLYVPELSSYMSLPDHEESIAKGLEEYRQEIGGKLALQLPTTIGQNRYVEDIDLSILRASIRYLMAWQAQPHEAKYG
ncbi:hypothetical protein [Pontibacter sp. G13]|uniref:3-dehydroquinate synthase family protein n=1 Tax=Pontibacter sp. G13 TaxID=3074898 RepID=UPI00288AE644|nr:hypothetical protein [Pontibacter sp. G13]WNJ17489.1 hypothetical protein RJD25_21790 [Pontibacter sp. G13]